MVIETVRGEDTILAFRLHRDPVDGLVARELPLLGSTVLQRFGTDPTHPPFTIPLLVSLTALLLGWAFDVATATGALFTHFRELSDCREPDLAALAERLLNPTPQEDRMDSAIDGADFVTMAPTPALAELLELMIESVGFAATVSLPAAWSRVGEAGAPAEIVAVEGAGVFTPSSLSLGASLVKHGHVEDTVMPEVTL